MEEAVIVSGVRTAVGRSHKGKLASVRPDDLAALVVREAVNRAGIDPSLVEDVILGCAQPEAEQGLQIGRMISVRATKPATAQSMVPALIRRLFSQPINTRQTQNWKSGHRKSGRRCLVLVRLAKAHRP